MSKNTNYVSHKKSKVKTNGGPQLPSANLLVEGEIAVNYAKGVETLSIKNESGDIVTFSCDEYYSLKKLGSGFTGENSANTVTSVIEDNERAISASLNDLNERKLDASAYTPTDLSNYYTKDEVDDSLDELDGKFDDKLGSGFTGENSANTVTSVIEDNEEIISSALNDLESRKLDASAYTPTDLSNYYTKSEVDDSLDELDEKKLDASAYTPTDLSNYYTKNETSGATELSNKFNEYYTKDESDGVEKVISASLNDLNERKLDASAYTPTDLSNYYTKSEVDNSLDELDEKKLDASAYTPTDLSNYYTKDENDDKLGSAFTGSNSAVTVTEYIEDNEEIVSTALNDLKANKLDASAYTPTDLSNYYTKSETSGATEIASEFFKLGETVHNITNVTGASGGTNLCASWSGECEEITELYDGLNIQIKLPNGGHASGCTISINGGEKHKAILNATTSLTTQYASSSIVRFVYDANQSGTIYTGSSTTTSVTGVWKVSDYNTNTTYTVMPYVYLQNRRYYAGEKINRYMILLSKDESTLIPINTDDNVSAGTKTLTTEEFNPFGPILYYSATASTASGATIASGRTYQQYNVNLSYSFNTTNTLIPYRDVYMVAVPQSNGMAKLAPNPITQTLPTTDDGLIYIYLGCAYSNTTIAFTLDHPVYYFKDGKLRLFTSELGSAAYKDVENVIDETVSASTNPVSVGAVFSALTEFNQQSETISAALNYLNDNKQGKLPTEIIFEDDGIYQMKDNAVYPVSHPDISTQPSILPQRFGTLELKEVLIGNGRESEIPQNAVIIEAFSFNNSACVPAICIKGENGWTITNSQNIIPDYTIIRYVGSDNNGYYYY